METTSTPTLVLCGGAVNRAKGPGFLDIPAGTLLVLRLEPFGREAGILAELFAPGDSDEFGMADRAHHRPNQLSGGHRQADIAVTGTQLEQLCEAHAVLRGTIGGEFRTPLTLFLGPAEQLLAGQRKFAESVLHATTPMIAATTIATAMSRSAEESTYTWQLPSPSIT